MATQFPQYRARPYVSPYADELAKIEKQLLDLSQGTQSMYTPEQLQQRQWENDRDYKLGPLATLSGNESLGRVGGMMLKNALAGRTPQVTEKGVYDPLTAQWTRSPEYFRETLQNKYDRMLMAQAAGEQAWNRDVMNDEQQTALKL